MPFFTGVAYDGPLSTNNGAQGTIVEVTFRIDLGLVYEYGPPEALTGITFSGTGISVSNINLTYLSYGVYTVAASLIISPSAPLGVQGMILSCTTATNPPANNDFSGTGDFEVTAGAPPSAPTGLTAACVVPQRPQANFSASPVSGVAPLDVTFTDTSTGSPSSWLWEFGDGATSTSQNPTHTFAEGAWQVRLTAANSLGSTQIILTIVATSATVLPTSEPLASFTASPMLGSATLDVTFTDTSTGSPTSWAWDFGDGGTSTSQNPSHDFTSVGVYTVTLTATNSLGSTTAKLIIIVTSNTTPADNPPTAVISASQSSGIAPLTVNFSATCSTPPTSWAWDFGDGYTSALAVPSHIFTSPGNYLVQLTVTDTYGSTTSSIMIVVAGTFLVEGDNTVGYYVIDRANNIVDMFTMAGAFIGAFGGYGSGNGQFNKPTTLVVIRARIL